MMEARTTSLPAPVRHDHGQRSGSRSSAGIEEGLGQARQVARQRQPLER